jgi:hypothetical protein
MCVVEGEEKEAGSGVGGCGATKQDKHEIRREKKRETQREIETKNGKRKEKE